MIEYNFYIPLSPDLVWENLVQQEHVAEWWGGNVVLEPAKKGRFSEAWTDEAGTRRDASGMVTAFEPARRLQIDYRSHLWPRATRIEFLLSPEDAGCRFYFQHSGWDALLEEAARKKEVDAYTRKWQELLKKFVAYCTP